MNTHRLLPIGLWLGLGIGFSCVASPGLGQSFQNLGYLPGGTFGSVTGVSGDGSVAVGSSQNASANQEAFRWSNGVMSGLGFLPGGTASIANAASADGSVIVGYSVVPGTTRAFIWSNGGMSALLLPAGATNSFAQGISRDGTIIVGASGGPATGNNFHATVWSGAIVTDLGVPAGWLDSRAFSVSNDGTVVAGWGRYSSAVPFTQAFSWTGGVMTALGFLPGDVASRAFSISADGTRIVGWSQGATTQAVRWDNGVISGLGFLPGDTESQAKSVSADGSVVVGYSGTGGTPTAVRWTASTAMQSVQALLSAAGVNMAGWSLYTAEGVSANGGIIVGNGFNPATSQLEPWIARLCDLPGTCAAGGGTGIITVSDQLQSFSSLGAVGQTAAAALGVNFSTVTNYVMQGGTANSANRNTPFSVFAALGYDSDPTVSGTFGGTVKINEHGLIAGVTAGADNIRTANMHEGGFAKMNAGTFGAFVAQVPEAGWQWLVGTNGIFLNGKISRGYLNGSSAVNSNGSTRGAGYGLAGRLGYTYAGPVPKTQVTPFVSYAYTHVTFSGYSEIDGPFPAVINAFHDVQQVSRVGVDARFTFNPRTWIWGTLAWGHRLDGGRAPEISGTLVGLFPLTAAGTINSRRDWAEVTTGVRVGAWKNGGFTASLTANLPDRGVVNYVANLGVSQAF